MSRDRYSYEVRGHEFLRIIPKKEKLIHGFYSSTHPGSVDSIWSFLSVNLLFARGANMPQIGPQIVVSIPQGRLCTMFILLGVVSSHLAFIYFPFSFTIGGLTSKYSPSNIINL